MFARHAGTGAVALKTADPSSLQLPPLGRVNSASPPAGGRSATRFSSLPAYRRQAGEQPPLGSVMKTSTPALGEGLLVQAGSLLTEPCSVRLGVGAGLVPARLVSAPQGDYKGSPLHRHGERSDFHPGRRALMVSALFFSGLLTKVVWPTFCQTPPFCSSPIVSVPDLPETCFRH